MTRARARGSHAPSGRSSRRTSPPVGCRRPATMSSSVLLPAPLRPMTTTTSPARTSNDTPDNTGRPPTAHATRRSAIERVIAPVPPEAATPPTRAASTTRGPGTTRASVVAAWTRRVFTARQHPVRAPEPLVDRLPLAALGIGITHVDRVDDHVGIEAQHRLHRDARILRLSGDRQHIRAAGDLDQFVDVRARSDGDEIGEPAGAAADDEEHPSVRPR